MRHWKQATAFFLTAALVTGSSSFAVFAEEAQTEAEQKETYIAELLSEEPVSETADTEKEPDTTPEISEGDKTVEEAVTEATSETETETVTEVISEIETETATEVTSEVNAEPASEEQKNAKQSRSDFPSLYPDEYYYMEMFTYVGENWSIGIRSTMKPGETIEIGPKINYNYDVDGEHHADEFLDFYVEWEIIEGKDAISIEVNKENNQRAYLTVNEDADECEVRIKAHIMHQNDDGSVEELECYGGSSERVITIDKEYVPELIKDLREGEDGKLYYYVGDEIDAEFEGIPNLKYQKDKYYIKNGTVATDMNGLYLIEDERDETTTGDRYYFFKNGKVDGGYTFTGLAEYEDGTKFYIEYGVAVTDLNGPHWVSTAVDDGEKTTVDRYYFFTNGKVDTSFEGIVEVNFANLLFYKYYIKNGTVATDMNGLHWIADELDDTTTGNQFYYFTEGEVDKGFVGLTEYNGGKFYIKNGTVATDMNGLHLIEDALDETMAGDKFYFFSLGQIQNAYKGLALYDNEWFYLENGYLDTDMNGIVEYNGGKFIVAAGRIAREANGLWQDPKDGKWHFTANGQLQTQHTGIASYDGQMFYIISGELATNYNGTIKHNGVTYTVVNGQLYK